MKILPQHLQSIVGAYRKAAKDASADASGPQMPRDQIELSDEASEISAARRAYDGLSDVRAAKVAALRTQIQNGTYRLDNARIADAILTGVPGDLTDLDED